jgi:hypothetical protein
VLPAHPTIAGKHLNPATGIPPTHEWGDWCGRGFVSDSRFSRGSDSVIKRTSRDKTRKVYAGLDRQQGLS